MPILSLAPRWLPVALPRHAVLAVVLLGVSASARAAGPVVLAGGGSEDRGSWSDAPYGVLANTALALGGPVLVVDLEEPSSWLLDYFVWLGAESRGYSVPDAAAASEPDLVAAVDGAGAVFLPGGDQWEYITAWDGTAFEDAVVALHARGGAVGGTSAGAAALGALDFTAEHDTVYSEEALSDPLNGYMTVGDTFLSLVPGVLVDTHFTERARLGRLLGLVACHVGPDASAVLGMGVDSETAVVVEEGVARVEGMGTGWFLWTDDGAAAATCAPGTPLWTPPYRLAALTEGFAFDLLTRSVETVPDDAVAIEGGEPAPGAADLLVASRESAAAVARAAEGRPAGTVRVRVGGHSGVGAPELEAAWEDLGWVVEGEDGGAVDALDAAGVGVDFADAATGCCGEVVLLQGEACWGAGDVGVEGAEGPGALYYGTLAEGPGLGTVHGLVVAPQAWDEDTGENRQGGALWQLQRGNAREAWLLHGDARALARTDGAVHVEGDVAPVRLLRDGEAVGALSHWEDDGGSGPRQSAAVTSLTVQALGAAADFALGDAEDPGDDDTTGDDDTSSDDDVSSDDDTTGDDDGDGVGGPGGCGCDASPSTIPRGGVGLWALSLAAGLFRRLRPPEKPGRAQVPGRRPPADGAGWAPGGSRDGLVARRGDRRAPIRHRRRAPPRGRTGRGSPPGTCPCRRCRGGSPPRGSAGRPGPGYTRRRAVTARVGTLPRGPGL